MPTIEERYQRYRKLLERHGQAHLLTFWRQLDPQEQAQLLSDLEQVDFERCAPLIESYVVRRPELPIPAHIEPPRSLPAQPDAQHADLYARAERCGREAIRAGKVAAFTVAGGQGTRLGFDGPKGAFPISPVRSATLFQLFAESLLGVERRYGCRPRWYIMTSPANHDATQQFFAAQHYFGLSPDDVVFFPQGQMPAFLPDGKIALSAPHQLALGPDGHGGSLRALAQSGALTDMRTRGIEYISYFQVDNALVKTVDPLFIGLHILHESDVSSKAVHKANDLERVGNFCLADGKLSIIEYSDLPDELAHAKAPDGSRQFNAGNVAIHLLSRAFVERLTAADATMQLPWHRADKRIPALNSAGELVTPTAPNVVKLEMFVFDALPLGRNPLLMYTTREEEFSPVKNAEGVDSAVTARRDLIRRAARWLSECGCAVPTDAAGEPDLPLEIGPAFALDASDLRARLERLPELVAKKPLLLA